MKKFLIGLLVVSVVWISGLRNGEYRLEDHLTRITATSLHLGRLSAISLNNVLPHRITRLALATERYRLLLSSDPVSVDGLERDPPITALTETVSS